MTFQSTNHAKTQTPGQRRSVTVEHRKLIGLEIVRLDVHEDDRGFLYEVVRANDYFVPEIGQVTMLGVPSRGAVHAFQKHQAVHEWFTVVAGSAKFVFLDDRTDSSTLGGTDVIVISARRPTLIVVPPGVYHGWMALEDQTSLLSVASHVYDREQPDQIRTSAHTFDQQFGGSPWWIEAR